MSIKYEMNNEGVGAQYQRIIGLLGIAKKHGLKFIHRKITVNNLIFYSVQLIYLCNCIIDQPTLYQHHQITACSAYD